MEKNQGMNKEISLMMEQYGRLSVTDSKYALKEIIQELSLLALARTDFFSRAAFYGGTALRIFHGLDRFSEDMDFSLKNPNPGFNLQPYLARIETVLNSYGFEMKTEIRKKAALSTIKSAFLKGNTLIHLVKITSLKPPVSGVPDNEMLKIKLEIDTDPPAGARYEQKYRLQPQPYAVLLYELPSLFAGKLHALLCRNWRSRVKGRDFYDYLWYLSQGTNFEIDHLEQRMRQSGHWNKETPLLREDVKQLLIERFSSTDFIQAKEDVIPFIQNPGKTDIWSEDFFIGITTDYFRRLE